MRTIIFTFLLLIITAASASAQIQAEIETNTLSGYEWTTQFIFKPIISGAVWPISYFWDFGDGKTCYDGCPSHWYEEPGDYTVMLEAWDANADSATASVDILVQEWEEHDEDQYPLDTCDEPKPIPPEEEKEYIPTGDIHVDKLFVENYDTGIEAGSEPRMVIGFTNGGDEDLGRTRLKIHCYDLEIFRHIGPFEGPDKGDYMEKMTTLPIPEYAEPGMHTCRVTITPESGDKRTFHREILII
ncbi:PKD domain-containing protein [Candidatus Woesearchaeota archaeon]|nr:PKD domain-containing protein [Candidatus Woesearchaeota archaeon]